MVNLAAHLNIELYIEEWIIVSLLEFMPHEHTLIQDYLTMLYMPLKHATEYQSRLTLFFAKLSALSPSGTSGLCLIKTR